MKTYYITFQWSFMGSPMQTRSQYWTTPKVSRENLDDLWRQLAEEHNVPAYTFSLINSLEVDD